MSFDPGRGAPLATILVAVTLAAAPCPVRAQASRFDTVRIRPEKVGGAVWVLYGSGGNIGVSIGPDGALVVDDQFAPLSPKIHAALDSIGASRLRFILNTHYHGDHTGGNPVFGKEAPILAQKNVRIRLASPRISGADTTPPMEHVGLPIVTFADSLTVHMNGEEIHVVHYPHGHTDGDAVVYFPVSHVVHMGDDYWNGMFPFVDLEAGGSVQGMAAAVAAVLARIPDDTRVIPGHGRVSGVEGLRAFHRMLVGTMDVVRAGIRAGKTLDQLKAAGLPEEWGPWAGGFIGADRWIETLYQSLSHPPRERASGR
jgi:cyclase